MIVVNSKACSPEFNAAFAALESGNDVRMQSWGEGMYLRKRGDRIEIVRPGAECFPSWMGPSSYEASSSEWRIID